MTVLAILRAFPVDLLWDAKVFMANAVRRLNKHVNSPALIIAIRTTESILACSHCGYPYKCTHVTYSEGPVSLLSFFVVCRTCIIQSLTGDDMYALD